MFYFIVKQQNKYVKKRYYQRVAVMLVLFGLILVFAGIIAVQVPGLVKKGMLKELAVFSIFLSLAALYSLGQIYHLPLPNPTKTMEYLFEPAWKLIEGFIPM